MQFSMGDPRLLVRHDFGRAFLPAAAMLYGAGLYLIGDAAVAAAHGEYLPAAKHAAAGIVVADLAYLGTMASNAIYEAEQRFRNRGP